MSKVYDAVVDNGIGVLTIDSPPVNALGINVRCGLYEGFRALAQDPAVDAVVVICGGRTFFAGADISEFGRPPEDPDLKSVFDLIEGASKPVIAAIHGTALGGGYELALVCHYRIAVPSAVVGLPEVKLGLLPGAGGTQRLPRIVGVEAALDIITKGALVAAGRALDLGMVDALAKEGSLREDAIAYARSIVADGKPLIRVRDRQDKVEAARGKPEIFATFRAKNRRAMRGFRAPEAIVKAIEAAAEHPFAEGLAREWELFRELEDSAESAAQRYAFFAERESAKIPDIPASTPTLPVKSVGVIGAGTMGGGIAVCFLNAGIPVTLVETNEAALERGLGVIRRNYRSSADAGRITADEVEARMGLIRLSLALDALDDLDLVIEAVFEEMDVKKDIFRKLDKIARAGTILASNTSFLDLDDIAAVTSRPEWVIGLHFFSPANVMRLLEVVRGDRTSNDVVATGMKLAKAIGKVPVLSRVCDGFIANRIMARRGQQADAVILEGASPKEVDDALYDYGFAVGSFGMLDIVGLDVIGRGDSARSVTRDLVGLGRLGQKSGHGYYDYDDRRNGTPSPIVDNIIAAVAKAKGVTPVPARNADQLVARLLYPVVNEGARLLEEGIALRASDIDVAAILGYNWPVYTGGPMYWADTIGLPRIVEQLRHWEAEHGEAFRPAPLLVELAAKGGSFTRS